MTTAKGLFATAQRLLATAQRLLATAQGLFAIAQRLFATARRLLATAQGLFATAQRLFATSRRLLATAKGLLATAQRLFAIAQRLLATAKGLFAIALLFLPTLRQIDTPHTKNKHTCKPTQATSLPKLTSKFVFSPTSHAHRPTVPADQTTTEQRITWPCLNAGCCGTSNGITFYIHLP